MPRPLVVFVDVDDTLVRHVGSKMIPMPATINHVRSLASDGVELWCWSTGGAEYAESVAESLDVADCFAGFLPKPNVILDDQDVRDWRQCIEIGPGALASNADDYRMKIAEREGGGHSDR